MSREERAGLAFIIFALGLWLIYSGISHAVKTQRAYLAEKARISQMEEKWAETKRANNVRWVENNSATNVTAEPISE